MYICMYTHKTKQTCSFMYVHMWSDLGISCRLYHAGAPTGAGWQVDYIHIYVYMYTPMPTSLSSLSISIRFVWDGL